MPSRRRMLAAAALGFVYLAVVFGVALLGVVAAGVQIAARGFYADGLVGLALFGALLLALVRGLSVRFEPPPGLLLRPAQHPALFARLEAVRARLGAPPMDEVRLTPALNAGVVLTPRGLLPPRRTLLLGLPLLALETPAEVDATIAHELGHAYAGDDRAGARAARWQLVWARLSLGLGAGGVFSRYLFGPFFQWYGPWLDQRLRALSRHRELVADAAGASLFGPGPTAQGLVRDTLAGRRATFEALPALWRAAADHEEPPADALERFVAALAAPWPEAQGRLWLRAVLALPAPPDATHPSLAERLAALGVAPPQEPPAPAEPTAAQALLGDALPDLWAAVGALWMAEQAASWREAHARQREERARLAELEAVADRAHLPPDEEVELALLSAAHGPAARALPRLRRAAELAPERADVGVALGFALLEAGDEEGARLLGRALPRAPARMEEGLWRLLLDRLARGRDEEAAELADRLARWPDEWARFEREREGFDARDTLAPHDLDPGEVRRLAAALSGYPDVRRAWVVLKVVEALPEVPCRFLVIETRSDGERLRPRAAQRALAEALRASSSLPPDTTVLVAESGLREGMLPVVGLAERVPGALVYERPEDG